VFSGGSELAGIDALDAGLPHDSIFIRNKEDRDLPAASAAA
jgi:hypothetical protein